MIPKLQNHADVLNNISLIDQKSRLNIKKRKKKDNAISSKIVTRLAKREKKTNTNANRQKRKNDLKNVQ